MRPESDSPSTVVRSHDDRRASTSSESADAAADVSATATGAGGGVDDAAGATLEGVAGVRSGAVDCAATSDAAGSLPDCCHKIVPTSTAIPATPKSATNTRARRFEGTGTASLVNGGDNSIRDAAGDIDGVYECTGGDDGDDDRCGVASSVSSEKMLGGSGGGGSFAGSANAWNGTVRASSASASMSARASSSMPLTASSGAKTASPKSCWSSISPSVSRPRLRSTVGSGRASASPSAACTCAESTSSSRLASITICRTSRRADVTISIASRSAEPRTSSRNLASSSA